MGMPRTLQDEEAARLNELHRYSVFGTDPEAAFERIVKLVQRVFNVPVVQINFVDKARQWSKASFGLEACETDLEASFCVHTIRQGDVMVVLDATKNARLRDTRSVTNSPFIRFYAGAPLTTPKGHHLGALCLVDTVAHEHFGEEAQATLTEFAAMIVDVLELRLADQGVRAREARHHIVTETASDAIVTIDKESTVLYVNPAAEKIFGHRPEDMLGKNLTMIMPEYLRHVHDAGIKRYTETGQRHISWAAVEVPGLHKDGHEIDLEISFGEHLQDEQHLFTAIIRDVTERKRVEEERRGLHVSEQAAWREVQQANNRLAFLAEASRILSSSLDYEETLRRVVELCVPGIADWCALDILTVDGKIRRLAVTHKDPEKAGWARELQKRYPPISPVHRVLTSGQPAFYPTVTDELVEQVVQDSEHSELLYKVGFSSVMIVPLVAREQIFGSLKLVHAESGKHYREEDLRLAQELAGRAAIAIDNARLYQQAQELNEMLESRVKQRTDQLEAANRELEAFSYSVSHDLRAPLRGIDGFSQALEEDYAQELNGTAKRYLERIRAGTQRMGRLIDDLLNLSRLSRTEVRTQAVDLASVAEMIAEELKSRQPDRRVTFTVAKGMVAKGDERLLGIVLQNLLENAWKFTAKCDQACIEVGLYQAEEAPHAYFVKDNGAGFDMAYADKLFGAFQRLHSPSEFEGTGIGLATVQRIILRHGGRVWAESEVGRGATFYFTLAVEEGVGEVGEHDPR